MQLTRQARAGPRVPGGLVFSDCHCADDKVVYVTDDSGDGAFWGVKNAASELIFCMMRVPPLMLST